MEITKDDIKLLARKASEDGDARQYAMCVEALAGNKKAIDACKAVIREARGGAAR